MNHAALTARYRPQTFADVAGQATLKAILSRASLEDRVAPAYLFSGTRGVGKTTIARVFAKALNCMKAPAAEPCNECRHCKAITLGSFVDVVEIDGASNRGIDDVRRLKESVGYAPMEGRYKIFIIDEAHMLSREAFNALLKTLEEPPAGVTFIMATTEPHKFPATIISRSQHFVFKRLSDAELEAHLTKILELEGASYEDSALRLVARRASGSVRDAMSLLGQVLALGGEGLKEADVRNVLGLAGQELFFNILHSMQNADCAGLSATLRQMLDQGVDLGFFLREFSTMWRNLFMLKQAGQAAAPLVDLPEAELERWAAEAEAMDLAHIHAAWQLSLEGQRRVLTSLEPALALELLLLNIAMLPRLLSLDQLSILSRKLPAPDQAAARQDIASSQAPAEKKSPEFRTPLSGQSPAREDSPGMAEQAQKPVQPAAAGSAAPEALDRNKEAAAPATAVTRKETEAPLADDTPTEPEAVPADGSHADDTGDWDGFMHFLSISEDASPGLRPLLLRMTCVWNESGITLTPRDGFAAKRVGQPGILKELKSLIFKYCDAQPELVIAEAEKANSDIQALMNEARALPLIKELEKELGAQIIDCSPWYK